jgi:hypothetical protein
MVGIVLKGLRSVHWFLIGKSEHLHAVKREKLTEACAQLATTILT